MHESFVMTTFSERSNYLSMKHCVESCKAVVDCNAFNKRPWSVLTRSSMYLNSPWIICSACHMENKELNLERKCNSDQLFSNLIEVSWIRISFS